MSNRVEFPPKDSPLCWWEPKPPPLDPPLLNRGPGTKVQWEGEIACKSSFGVKFLNQWAYDVWWTNFFDKKIWPKVIEKLIEYRDLEEVSPEDCPGDKTYSIKRGIRVRDFDVEVTKCVKDVKMKLVVDRGAAIWRKSEGCWRCRRSSFGRGIVG
jgi:hypothetical protein